MAMAAARSMILHRGLSFASAGHLPLRAALGFRLRGPDVCSQWQMSAQRRCIAEVAAPGLPGAQRLSDIAKVPLLAKEAPSKVRDLWLENFQHKEHIVAGVLAQEEYKALKAASKECPMFLVPVPRGSGYVNFVWQAQGNRFAYSTLEGFQQQGASSVDFGVTLYEELLVSHKIVLLYGELFSQALTKPEGAAIIKYTREAYADPARLTWVKRFNHSPREFSYEEFLQEFRPLERWQGAAS
mmetsp:Transcript_31949/g.74815  ORF Transcript_31949/g.74815 Transcript_31949/m.74815 type:complete len:241 (+) Transcript_31949:55-777(+)